MSKNENLKPKKSRWKRFLPLFLAGFIIFLLLGRIEELSREVDNISLRQSSQVHEIGQIKADLGIFENEKDQALTNENALSMAMFELVESLGMEQKDLQKKESLKLAMGKIYEDEKLAEFLELNELVLSDLIEGESELRLNISRNEVVILSFVADFEEKILVIDGRDINDKLNFENLDKLSEEILAGLPVLLVKAEGNMNLYEKAESELSKWLLDEELRTLIAERELREEGWSFLNKNSEEVGYLDVIYKNAGYLKVGFNLVDNKEYELQNKAAFEAFVNKLDSQTFLEKRLENAISEVENTLLDAGFQSVIESYGLTVESEYREDEARIYFDIKAGDEVLKMIVIEKATGTVLLTESDGTKGQSLLMFESDIDSKKKSLEIPDELPEIEDADSLTEYNILIGGHNGGLLDTMILTNINEQTREIRMLSVPRDLYYNSRKLNSYRVLYGMEEMKRILGDITGYEPDNYVVVDMQAFIDVVDLVGGIDISLEHAVVDPSYRVVDNGVEGTLNYQPGDYHLSGVEALRLARTRKTSSDFARAERQQMILRALKEKGQNFGFGDSKTVYEIIRTVLAKTETDLSVEDAAALFFKYKDYQIVSMDVLSTGNILYSPPYVTASDCEERVRLAAEAEAPEPECVGMQRAYTLLPKNDDWNVIRWYVREKFAAGA